MSEEQDAIEWKPLKDWEERAQATLAWTDRVVSKFELMGDRVAQAIVADDFEAYLSALTEFPYEPSQE